MHINNRFSEQEHILKMKVTHFAYHGAFEANTSGATEDSEGEGRGPAAGRREVGPKGPGVTRDG
jgi:hypothetical protein